MARNDIGCRVADDACGVGLFGLDCRVACAPRNDKIVNVWGWVAFTPMRLINCLPMVMWCSTSIPSFLHGLHGESVGRLVFAQWSEEWEALTVKSLKITKGEEIFSTWYIPFIRSLLYIRICHCEEGLFETRRGNPGGVRVATRQIRFRWIAASLVFLTMTKL